MKLLADGGKPVVRVPPVVEIVQVQVTPAGVAAEVRDVAIAVPVLPHGTNVQNIFRATAL